MATIKVYGRVTPCSTVSNLVEIQGDRLITSKLGRRNSQKNTLEIGFTFSEIFDQSASQREVFDRIAKDVIGKFLEGYNGTVFAYGQTGTGKTYTIEGEELNLDVSPRHGLIPQTLSMIFNEIDKMKDECVTVQISFLEMYNEMAYDLLGPLMYGSCNRKDLPRVLVTHGTSGSCIMHGLSVHDVCSEQEARRLHLKGRCNRTMAWTSNNERSSRSHAVFMVLLTRQKQGSEIVVKSKLNLVDLAGSERLSKCNTEGQTLFQTKRINLSLHHLETVILALQRLHVQGTRNSLTKSLSREELRPKRCKSAIIPEHERRLSSSFNYQGWNGLKSAQSTLTVAEVKHRGISLGNVSSYIPYRNSLLTMILQDSLGGNCNTTMIATLSLDTNDLNETISTCRFAQRVARVTNNPVQNKEISEAILIKKLKNQVAKLVQDLANVRQNQNGKQDSPQQENEKEVIEVVDGYIEGRIVDPTACGIDSPRKVRACLAYLKNLLMIRTPRLSEEPTSSDEKDSGVGMNCDPSVAVNDNTEEELSSPVMAGTDSGGTSEESIPSSPPITQTEVTKKQRRDGQQISPCFKPPQQSFPETIAREATNCSTETQINASTEEEKPSVNTFRETEKQLILLELEIKKEKFIQKSKILSTALANQKARVIVMEKHGCPMNELDNERLAEQQLRRKQAEVEKLLSNTIKNILDTKAISTINDVTADQNIDVSGIQGQSSEIDSQVYHRRKLELKERSTRLRLLTCRQQLDRGLTSTGSPEIVLKTTESNHSDTCADEANTRETSPLNSSDESVFSKTLDISSRKERPLSVRSRDRLLSARAQSSTSIRTTITENKRKSKFGVLSFRSGSNRQARGLQVNSARTAKKSHMNASRQSHALPSNGRISQQCHASPSNVKTIRQSYVLPNNGRSRVSPSNSQSTASSGEDQGYGKAVDRSRMRRPAENPDNVQKADRMAFAGAVCSRSRRPAMCSPALVTNKLSMKRSTRPGSSSVHYEYDHNKGFIVRTNEDVYRASNFRQPVPDSLGVQILDIKRNLREESSPGTPPEDSKKEQGLDLEDDVTPVSRGREMLPPIVSDVTKKEKPIDSHSQSQRTKIDSERALENEVLKGPQSVSPKKLFNNDEPKRELMVQRIVPPTVISARKQQIERARRIRQVTNAVEVIQDAYRRYLWRKTKAIQPISG